jgi:hypothetical protein
MGYLSKTERKIHDVNNVPGVGAYVVNYESIRGKSPGFKFRAHHGKCGTKLWSDNVSETSVDIGPGAYDTFDSKSISSTTRRIRGGGFSKDNKYMKTKNLVPGPGAYDGDE